MFDTMQHIRSEVVTINVGLAASMASFILAAGAKVNGGEIPSGGLFSVALAAYFHASPNDGGVRYYHNMSRSYCAYTPHVAYTLSLLGI